MEFIQEVLNKINENNKNYHKIQLLIGKYNKIQESIENNLKLKNVEDEELNVIINAENSEYELEKEDIIKDIKKTILKDENNAIILEIRSGEGGDEASLFAFELMNMYQKLCKLLNYQFKILNLNTNEVDGLKEGVFEIIGTHAYANLFHENGVHCVKRVPKTEKKGRTHTSTATVAVLKQPNDVEVVMNEKDLKIETFRSSGPGGQSVNTTDSAIRITHIPTKIVVSQQDEKSQHKNKEKALKILKIRIYAKKTKEEDEKYSHLRKIAIGTAKRNERIRTYYFNQNYVKDSRIDSVCYNTDDFMNGIFLNKILNDLLEQYIINII